MAIQWSSIGVGYEFGIATRMLVGLRFRRKTAEQWPDFGKVFYADGEPPEVGEIIRQPDLANSLKQIAERGRDAFYRGKLAKAMVNGTRAAGGTIGCCHGL